MNKRTSRIGMIRKHTRQPLPKIKALDEDRGFRRIKRVAKIINLRTAQNKPVFNLRIADRSSQNVKCEIIGLSLVEAIGIRLWTLALQFSHSNSQVASLSKKSGRSLQLTHLSNTKGGL